MSKDLISQPYHTIGLSTCPILPVPHFYHQFPVQILPCTSTLSTTQNHWLHCTRGKATTSLLHLPPPTTRNGSSAEIFSATLMFWWILCLQIISVNRESISRYLRPIVTVEIPPARGLGNGVPNTWLMKDILL